MASIIECEQELACLSREIDEQFDEIEGILSWFLTQNNMKSTINNILSIDEIGLLKAMQMETANKKSQFLGASTSLPWEEDISESLKSLRIQTTSDADELDNMFTHMRSGAIGEELEKCRSDIREVRNKKHALQQKINEKKKSVSKEEMEMTSFIDGLKDMLRDIRASVSSHQQEVQKSDMLNEMDYNIHMVSDICE